ncbi:mechanosensitive ion channel protein MscS [Arsenicicoccus bolidensis]|uniref:Mechanosensitive ion channel protein MscS n=1 Tax=Arsenicicoccus bolidensis TaxID=229480 RepID=A0ABS9Q0D4_9MICO|nr:mechanosensitive ion channel protein MscS [Arsenicicoccus bolidensis]MCG7321345.1 mechanosensitive ion channel protein MscS [Arsenicicoccus bolidensis]
MGKEDDSRVQIPPARSGRPSSTTRRLPPNALVRVEVRMPAVVAAQVFALAAANGRPVSATASDLLAAALAEREEGHVT